MAQFPIAPPPPDVELDQPEHFIQNILPPNQSHILAGASGVGKTRLVATLLRSLQTGEPFLDLETTPPAEIGVIVCDRSWQDHRLWFDAAGVQNLKSYSMVDDRSLDMKLFEDRKKRTHLLSRFLDRLDLPPHSLVFVDPQALFYGGDLMDYDRVTLRGLEINRICRDRKVTLIGACHGSKQKADPRTRYARPQDRVIGSAALLGVSGTCMYLAGPSETISKTYEFTVAPHHAPAKTWQLDVDPISGLFVPVGLPDDPDPASLMDASQGMVRVLSVIPTADDVFITTRDILDLVQARFNLKRAMVMRYLARLEARGQIERVKLGVWKRKTTTPVGPEGNSTH